MKAEKGDIAIVGMACLFPGAPDLSTYWQNIVDGVDCISDPPADWGGQYSYDPQSAECDRIYCQRGGYLGELSRFDPVSHGIMPKAVDGSEPEHFLALRVATDALRDTGFPDIPIHRERTEVILGRGTFINRALTNLHQHGFVLHQTLTLLKELHPEYTDEMLAEIKAKLREKLPPFDALTAAGVVSSIMSGRIANRLDLKGANYCLDAACASSLLCVEHACRDLRHGQCDAVIAGAAQLSANHLVLMVFSQLGALSRSLGIRPFDANADGTLLGEGVGMVVLKRRSDAERDGNRIYSVIKGVGSSSDGRAKSIVAPRIEGEELALQRAYEDAGVDPATIGMIEAHGTSIPLGDAAEIEALTRLFGQRNGRSKLCGIGSVKSMIGHLIPAAGIAGLIKTALSLYHKTLPPTIHCDQPDPKLYLENTPFYINTKSRPWINATGSTAPRRAGVNAFGFGGINAHAVLEEYPEPVHSLPLTHHHKWESELCVFAGESREELIESLTTVQSFISSQTKCLLRNVAYSLSRSVVGRPYRISMVCKSIEELSRKIEHALRKLRDPACVRIKDRSGIYFFENRLAEEGRVAFVFPGEGSQYPEMLSDLCVHFPEVRRCFDLADRAFGELAMGWLLSDVIYPPPTCLTEEERKRRDSMLWGMEAGVQAVTTANRAMLRLLNSLGLRADVVVGHSSGEFGALEAAGAIKLDTDDDMVRYILDGVKSVRGVSAEADKLEEMALIAASTDNPNAVLEIARSFNGCVQVTMDNCPYQIVVGASKDRARDVVNRLHEAGVSCTSLPFARPYHCAAFRPAVEPLNVFFESLNIVSPHTPIYSCATAGLFPGDAEAMRTLAVAQWSMPVRFRETIRKMHDDGVRIFIEVGPRQNLTNFIGDSLRDREHLAVASNVQQGSGITSLHHCLGLLTAHGIDVKLERLFERRDPKTLDFADFTSDARTAHEKMPKLRLDLPIVYLDRNQLAPPPSISVEPDQSAVTNARPSMRFEQRQPERNSAPDKSKPRSEKSKVLQAYLDTMGDFLTSQQSVMSTFLAKRRGHLSPKAKSISPQTASTGVLADEDVKPVSAAPMVDRGRGSAAPMRHPFIGTIVLHVPGRELVIRRELEVEKDLFLRHHVLGGRVSMLDESLEPLAVMPLTMSMEMIGEAAVALVPDKKLIGMCKVRSHRWITLEHGRIGLEMTARRVSDIEVQVEMREADAVKPLASPIIEGTMILADDYPLAPPPERFELQNARTSRFVQGSLYTTGMFNGPSFQAIREVQSWGTDGSIATFEALPTDRLFRDDADPQFVTDPVLLDSAGQQAAHWNAEDSSSGFNFFPYRFDELRIYGPPVSAPEQVESHLRIKKLSDGQYSSDITLVDSSGRVRFELIAWEDREFELPEAIYGIRYGAPEIKLGREWPELAKKSGLEENCECRIVDEFSRALLLGHGRLWLKVLAYQILSRREREFWHTSTMTDQRRLQWLIGRAAAKEAVRQLLKRQHGIMLCPADIEIDTTPEGKPIAKKGLAGFEKPPAISIAHTGETAVAIAVEAMEGLEVGIDIERLRPVDEDFLSASFGEEEQLVLSSVSDAERRELVIRLWCAKEAAGKALGTGLRGDPTSFEIRSYDPETGSVEVAVAGSLGDRIPSVARVAVRVTTMVAGDLVAAVAVHRGS
ncbi:MAG: beta-ketoacyl synthase N-terminal-like domain-containing protein [Planctomycetota bacterium]|mgnify:CR=1 FL=1